MSNNPQRSFAAGELAPALFARTDLARYIIGLRTCRNMVVMRAGGATKRPGTQYCDTAGQVSGYILTLTPTVTVTVGQNVAITATLTDFLGNPVSGFACAFQTSDATKATVTATGPLTATVHGVAGGSATITASIVALNVTSSNCVATVSDYYVLHAFTGNGNAALNVTNGGTADRIVMVAGGGSGGSVDGNGVCAGAGGAGEFLRLDAPTLTPGVYALVVGAGGQYQHADHVLGGNYAVMAGTNGGDTTGFGRTCKGGGGGGGPNIPVGTSGARNGAAGGSGGGGGSCGDGTQGGGGGSTHDTTDLPHGQGYMGGPGVNSSNTPGGGGGGATQAGNTSGNGVGGAGVSDDITGTAATFAAGGTATVGNGGRAADGVANTGNGGNAGGNQLQNDGGNGGSGVIYVRYRASSGIVATGGIKTTFPAP